MNPSQSSGCPELTEAQLSTTNGCGSSYPAAWIFRIPRWVSRAFFRCCNRHDIRYQLGVTLQHKWEADDELLDCMYYSAFHGPWYQKNAKLTLADFVYTCLRSRLSEKCFKKNG